MVIAPNIVPAIGNVVAVAGQLSGVLGLLPAGAGAAALAIGSLKIATMGFGDAIKAVGDPAKFNEAVAKLAPAAQESARAILGLMPQITQLRMTVQDAFFQGFGEQFTRLGTIYLPVFEKVMCDSAQSVDGMRASADLAEKAEFQRRIDLRWNVAPSPSSVQAAVAARVKRSPALPPAASRDLWVRIHCRPCAKSLRNHRRLGRFLASVA